MEYAQLNESKTEALQVTTHGNIEWDSTHFCPASALTKDEATLFRVVPLIVTDQPAFDSLTQAVIRDGCEQVDGAWRYKWRIDALTPEQIEAKRIAAESARIASLWQAAHDYEYAQVSGSAIGLLSIGVLQSLPKCLAVQGWIKGIWSAYYERKATGSHDADYSVAGTCPHTVPELMAELGL